MPNLHSSKNLVGFWPHLMVGFGILTVSIYIFYLLALNSISKSAQHSFMTPQPPVQISDKKNDVSLDFEPQPAVTTPMQFAINSQTNQQPFDATIEITYDGFSPTFAQLSNQQLLRIFNNSSTAQIVSLGNDSLMIYPLSEYVFNLDKLTPGDNPLYADSEDNNTQQANIQII